MARTQERAWLELDLQRARAYGDTANEIAMEQAMVRFEHADMDADDDVPCPNPKCDDYAQYRPTVGAMQCPSCRSLASRNGDAISITS